ncbi:MAG: hypothetical protein JWP97_6885, partial [Labilithrix sp.]|nr:hypothetical protein [Labilithrix sp.]
MEGEMRCQSSKSRPFMESSNLTPFQHFAVNIKKKLDIKRCSQSLGSMYYVGRNGQQSGPFTIEQLKEQLANGQLAGGDLVWTEGMANWIPASTLPGLAPAMPASLQHQPPVVNPYPQPQGQQPLYAAPNSQIGGGGYYGQPISNYLWQSIVVTILCCLPFGIVAIVYASGVDGKAAMGDFNGAKKASNSAKNWCIAAVVTSLVGV